MKDEVRLFHCPVQSRTGKSFKGKEKKLSDWVMMRGSSDAEKGFLSHIYYLFYLQTAQLFVTHTHTYSIDTLHGID